MMRPVVEGVCDFVWLLDGSIDAAHVALMNDALTVKFENQRRLSEKIK